MRTGRPPTMRSRLIEILLADESPTGMTHGQLMSAMGFADRRSLSSVIGKAHEFGRIFAIGKLKDMRYFGTAERREACRGATEALIATEQAARKQAAKDRQKAYDTRRRQDEAFREKDRLRCRKKRAAEPAKREQVVKPVVRQPKQRDVNAVVPPKPSVPAPVVVKGNGTHPRKDGPAIVPAHVRVQVCPSGIDRRYAVPEGYVGEFTQQWKQLRGRA